MIIERSMSPTWLSNSYLVADRRSGRAILIDSGGPPEPLLARIEADRLTKSPTMGRLLPQSRSAAQTPRCSNPRSAVARR